MVRRIKLKVFEVSDDKYPELRQARMCLLTEIAEIANEMAEKVNAPFRATYNVVLLAVISNIIENSLNVQNKTTLFKAGYGMVEP